MNTRSLAARNNRAARPGVIATVLMMTDALMAMNGGILGIVVASALVLAPVRSIAAGARAARPTPGCRLNDEGVLPAGTYRRTMGSYLGFLRHLLRCPDATHVAVSGVHATPAEAAADVARLPPGWTLPPGYPWLEHTDLMALVEGGPSGVAVVLATFATRVEADAWARRHADPRVKVQIRELASEEGADRRHLGNPEHALVRIPPGPDVEALSFDDAQAAVNALGTRDHRLTDTEVRRHMKGTACRVRGGSIFLVKAEELFPPGLGGRNFAPVRCDDGRTAYVPWTRTLLESVIWQDRAGRVHVAQIVAVFCDEPDEVFDWLYDPTSGRKGPPRRLPLRTGCR